MKTGDSGVAPAQGSGRMASGTQHDFKAEPIMCAWWHCGESVVSSQASVILHNQVPDLSHIDSDHDRGCT